jgi:coenzyme PQQ precursor peptide PqqA
MCNQRCARILARTPEPNYSVNLQYKLKGKTPMAWTTPTLIEICVGLEINGYLPAEF